VQKKPRDSPLARARGGRRSGHRHPSTPAVCFIHSAPSSTALVVFSTQNNMAPPPSLPSADACVAAARAAIEQGATLFPLSSLLLLVPLALLSAALLYVIVDALQYAAIPTIEVPLTEGEEEDD
jgi:hypothetical protein